MSPNSHPLHAHGAAGSATIAIIPARGGSKGVPGKNIRPLGRHPLIAYSIAAAQAMSTVERVIVTTDSEEIAAIARAYGAEVPFLRPAELSGDKSIDREFFVHALDWLEDHEGTAPEYWVHLRPTTPLREPSVLDDAVSRFLANPDATALRSAHAARETPYKWFEMDDAGFFQGIRPNDPRPEYYNLPRQDFPTVYDPNGYIDIVKTSQFRHNESLHGPKIMGFITEQTHEIDIEDDYAYLSFLLERRGSPLIERLDQQRAISRGKGAVVR